VALATILLSILLITLAGCGGGSSDPGQIEVPINLKGADNLGSLGFDLSYDSSVLEVKEITTDELAANAMMEYNITSAGKIVIGIIDSSGINGDGPVVKISFDVLDGNRESSLEIGKIEAYDAITLIDISTGVSAGSYENGQIVSPVITFSP